MGALLRNFGRPYDFGQDYEGHLLIGDYFTGRIRRICSSKLRVIQH
jgi:hypothetical protein